MGTCNEASMTQVPAVLKLKVGNGALLAAAAEEAAEEVTPVPGALPGAPHVKRPAKQLAAGGNT